MDAEVMDDETTRLDALRGLALLDSEASLGRPGDGPWDLVARADDALYLGKRSRRGEVRLG